VPGLLLKIEARQRKEHERGKTKQNDGADPPFAIVVLFHIGISHCISTRRNGSRSAAGWAGTNGRDFRFPLLRFRHVDH
jgi:hypothetical protein